MNNNTKAECLCPRGRGVLVPMFCHLPTALIFKIEKTSGGRGISNPTAIHDGVEFGNVSSEYQAVLSEICTVVLVILVLVPCWPGSFV